jgi:hypothetical protein
VSLLLLLLQLQPLVGDMECPGCGGRHTTYILPK